jgi:peptidoglycan L-alanyl-D-glutamate endopeptidase CwlK
MDEVSTKRLSGVHPDLVAVVEMAFTKLPPGLSFRITEGLRNKERQARLVASGASRTMNSRHLTGHAVDLVALTDLDGDGKMEVRWDWPLYYRLADVMLSAAAELNVSVVWGGSWRTFPDGPHFELDRKRYP